MILKGDQCTVDYSFLVSMSLWHVSMWPDQPYQGKGSLFKLACGKKAFFVTALTCFYNGNVGPGTTGMLNESVRIS